MNNPTMMLTLRFFVQIYQTVDKKDRRSFYQVVREMEPFASPPEPFGDADPTYWPVSYREWSMTEKAALNQQDYQTEMGSFGFGDEPPIVNGMLLLRIDPHSDSTRLYRAISLPNNSSGTANRWYVNASSISEGGSPT